MSTYNGGRFIREQLDSLVKQEKVRLRILIRDDGSVDGTVDIIKEYMAQYPFISFYQGENRGAPMSFLELCAKADDSDYFAFCDQDDVWDKDKLICAVKYLDAAERKYGDIPLLYYSNLRVTDTDLKFLRRTYTKKRIPIPKTKYTALAEVMASGNTFVFNNALRKLVNRKTPKWCSMHDSWLFLIASIFGRTVYDDRAHIDYRQHGDNASVPKSAKMNLKHYALRFAQLFRRTDEPRYNNARNFEECFSDLLEGEDLAEVRKVTQYKDGFGKKMRLFFDPKLLGTTVVRDLSNRFLILTNNF